MNITFNYTQAYAHTMNMLNTGFNMSSLYMNNVLYPTMNEYMTYMLNMSTLFLNNYFNIPSPNEMEIYITFGIFSLLFFTIIVLSSEGSYYEEYQDTLRRVYKYKKGFSTLQKRYETLLSEVKSYRSMMKNYLNIRDENDVLKSSGLNKKLLETILNLAKTNESGNMSVIVNIIERELNPVGKKRPRRMASPLYFESS